MAAVFAISMEFIFTFSNAEKAAAFLSSISFADKKIIGERDAPVSAIAGLLQKDIFYPNSGFTGTYIIWDNTRKEISDSALVKSSNGISLNLNKDIVAVLNHRINTLPINWNLLNSFEGAIVWDENFYIYLIHPTKIKS